MIKKKGIQSHYLTHPGAPPETEFFFSMAPYTSVTFDSRSPDSALQSGLDKKPVFPSAQTVLWKGTIFMADLGKFGSQAYRVSGDVEHLEKVKCQLLIEL